jgi:hypothetical protein
MGERIKKMRYIYTMEFYSAMKKNKITGPAQGCVSVGVEEGKWRR